MMKNDDSDYADTNVFLMTNKAKTEDIQPDVDTGIGTLRKRAAKNDQYHYFDNEEKELMDGNSDVDSVDLSEGSEYDIDDDEDNDDDEKTDADQSDDEADREVQVRHKIYVYFFVASFSMCYYTHRKTTSAKRIKSRYLLL